MFPKGSMFCAYKRFPNLKDLVVHDDPCSIKPLKEMDQDPGCSDCMKRCDSCKNSCKTIYHLLNVLQPNNFKNQTISYMHHTKYDTFSILQKMWQTRCWINWK